MTTATAATPPASDSQTPRKPVSVLRQALRLTRTEFTLFYRYQMALYSAALPLIFLLPLSVFEPYDVLPGVDTTVLSLTWFFPIAALTVGLSHVPNVYAIRRERLILKRLRVSGVTPAAIFTSTVLSVFSVVVVQTVLVAALLASLKEVFPTAPVLFLVSLALTTVVMVLLGVLIANFARNGESAQIISMVPFFLLIMLSGLFGPVDLLPDGIAMTIGLLPMLPAVRLAQSAYLGYDLFDGISNAEAATGVDLWLAAGPSLLILVAWMVLLTLLLRIFQWDPRVNK